MRKHKVLFASLIVVLLACCQAQAVSIKGRAVSTISDILRYARGLGNVSTTDTALELGKASVLRMDANGQLTLRHNIGNAGDGGQESSLGKIANYLSKGENSAEGDNVRDNGLLSAVAQTSFNNNKVVITSSRSVFNFVVTHERPGILNDRPIKFYEKTNWFYDIYFMALSKDENGSVSQSRFGAYRYPNKEYSEYSGYIKDIKTGIFVEGFNGELVVAAAMETVKDNDDLYVEAKSKNVASARLDFWALFADDSGNVQYKKLDNLTQTKSGFDVALLNGIINASDGDWASYNNNRTFASPYMLIKTAVGDFNDDGFDNEIAMLTADKKGINLCVYQIRCENNNFTIRTMSDVGRIYSYSNPDYITTWSYNGWNRMPGAEILAGDFDGDGKTELGVVFQGDISSGNRSGKFYGGTVGNLYTYLYKWNNNTGKFDVRTHDTSGVYATRVEVEDLPGENYIYYANTTKYPRITHKYMAWGGIKAVTADLDGDGRDEIVFAGYESELREFANLYIYSPSYNTSDTWYDGEAWYYAYPYVGLIKIASDGKLKPLGNYVWKGEAIEVPGNFFYNGDTIICRRFGYQDVSYQDLLNGNNPFRVQEYMLAPFGQNAEVFPVADREMSLTAGPLFGQSGIGKERDDIALRSYGGKLMFFKSDGSTLKYATNVGAGGTSTIVAADFAGEGVELGSPVRIVNQRDRSYTAVLQGIPYHVDTIAADGKSVTPEPINFSYTKGSKAEYSTSATETEKTNTKFNMSSTVETVLAFDSSAVRTIAGAIAKLPYITVTKTAKPSTLQTVKNTVGTVVNFLKQLPDKVEHIKEGYDAELQEQNVFKSIFSDRFDVISYVYANQYLWRYPLLTSGGAYFGTYSEDVKYAKKQDFLTFAIYDDTNSDTFGSDPSYQPTHENGNLFSYPAAIGNIEGYNYRQKDLSDITGVQFGIPTVLGFTKIKSNEHEETESTVVTTGYLTKAASLIDKLFGTNLVDVPESSTGPTFTKSTSSRENFTLTLPNADGARLLGSYRLEAQAFVAEDGALTCGFAVNHFDPYASLFNSGSLYRQLPDPSFVLPKKFVLTDSYPLIPTFGANPERELAMEMRGVRFYAVDFNMYTTNRLLDGAKYSVEVPMYNASFKPADNVRVDLYWVTDRTEKALESKKFIGTTYVSMTGWSDTGDNKAWAKFEFTPFVAPNSLEAGKHYQLYAVIDSEKKMPEVHENRDLAVDSGGNNEGYFEFSVETVETAAAASAVKASAGLDDFEFPDISIKYSGYETWGEFYDAKVASTDGPVSLDVVIVNNSSYTLPDTELKAVYYDEELWENEKEIPAVVFGHSFTMFPHETYRITAVIDDDLADTMRRVGKDNTFCHYTMFWVEDLLEEAGIVLSADENPELEVLSGDVESADDGIAYCTATITRTFTLSSDTPVFWRVNGVAQVIDSSESNSNDVYISPANPTEEDFAVTWNPEAVKTESIELTISTIPGTTPLGNYGFRVETSEDGENWEQKDFLTIEAVSSSNVNTPGSSSGGCDAGFSVMALAGVLAAVLLKRR